MVRTMMVIVAAAVAGSAALATTSDEVPSAQTQAPICKTVVSAERGAKPYQLCMSRAEWDAKKIADAKDANRIVCHYEEQPGTRFRSAKVCQAASEWEQQRQADRQAIERIQMQSCVPGAGC